MVVPKSITQRSVAGEGSQQVYDVHVFGETIETTVTKSPLVVSRWIDEITANRYIHRYIGLEIEYNDIFSRIGTLQLCDGERCLVIQILDWPYMHPSVEKFLNNHHYVFMGSNIIFKMKWLRRAFHFSSREMICKQVANKVPEFKVNLMASVGLLPIGNWTRTDALSLQQVHYACAHVFLLFHMINFF